MDIKTTRIADYATLDDMQRAAAPHISKREFRPDFFGCTQKELEARRYSWTEGIQQMNALTKFNATPAAYSRPVKRWNDYDGDELDIERLWNGQDPLSKRVKVAGGRGRGRQRTIYICAGENWTINAKDMLWKSFAAGRLCDDLEAAGERIEIYTCFYAREMFERPKDGKEDFWLMCKVKSANEPLNIGAVLTATAPWSLRVWMLAAADAHGKTTYSYGFPRPVRQAISEPQAIVIDTSEVLSEAAANDWIKRNSAL
jgi:hypothetical protein